MKPKLLITLGCSYTEGVGCYDYNFAPKNFKEEDYVNQTDKVRNFNALVKDEYKYFYKNSIPRFHELGWPNRLGKKLGYDKVINLGLAGASASGNLKIFYEKYYNKDLSDYNVLVIWLLPSATRTSIYLNKMVHSAMLTEDNQILKYYLENNSQNVIHDMIYEQIFLLKVMETFCQLKNYSFLFSNALNESFDLFLKEYESNTYLSKDKDFYLLAFPQSEKLYEYHCFEGHPNEKGYEYMSDTIFNLIKLNHPHLLSKTIPNKFEWEWDGNPIKRVP